MNMEDMIVSTLITVSPQQIVIHTRQPELPVMRTLETIFELRVRSAAMRPLSVSFRRIRAKLSDSADKAPGKRIRNEIP